MLLRQRDNAAKCWCTTWPRLLFNFDCSPCEPLTVEVAGLHGLDEQQAEVQAARVAVARAGDSREARVARRGAHICTQITTAARHQDRVA